MKLSENKTKWDLRFLLQAKEIAKWSKDPSSNIGAIAVGKNKNILATGYNGFPRGIEDTEERYNNREEKYKYVVHAEKNLIYNACWNGVSLEGSTVYVYGLPVCHECAKGLIQVGTRRVVINQPETVQQLDSIERWKDSFELTKEMFKEVEIKYDKMDLLTGLYVIPWYKKI